MFACPQALHGLSPNEGLGKATTIVIAKSRDIAAQSLIYAGQIMADEKQLQEYSVPKVRRRYLAAESTESMLSARDGAPVLILWVAPASS